MRILFVIFILGSNFVQSQNYIDYTGWITRADHLIINNKQQEALLTMDSIDKHFDFIYASHCVKGLQLSLYCSDSIRASTWLKRCFLQGVPIWMLKQHSITSAVFKSTFYAPIIAQQDSYRHLYNSRINLKLRKTIDSLNEMDQFRTDRVNNGFLLFRNTVYGLQWLNRNKKNFEIIKSITEKYGFPGERLIGLSTRFNDSILMQRYFSNYGPEPNETMAYIVLIHYFSTPRKNINPLLIEQVKNGNLPSYQYASINDFIAKYGRSKNDSVGYYNEWHSDKDSSQLEAINSRRIEIGLGNIEFKKKLNLIELNYRRNKGTMREINLN